MPYEEIKKLIIENAWFDFSVDYGLLHLQLATPVLVFCLLLFVIFMMNKLLFQPVFQTLNNRQKIVETSKTRAAAISVEISKLRKEYEEQLNAARIEVNNTYNAARLEAIKQKDSLIKEVRETGEKELEKGKISLAEELQTAKSQLQNLTQSLAESAANRLLN
ncbi:MAG: ATP synthase F0 subunit B [SAR324 cluster bacterium]|nr:ATP synthase F0 subunit B [SAR324 cluster bacterium]